MFSFIKTIDIWRIERRSKYLVLTECYFTKSFCAHFCWYLQTLHSRQKIIMKKVVRSIFMNVLEWRARLLNDTLECYNFFIFVRIQFLCPDCCWLLLQQSVNTCHYYAVTNQLSWEDYHIASVSGVIFSLLDFLNVEWWIKFATTFIVIIRGRWILNIDFLLKTQNKNIFPKLSLQNIKHLILKCLDLYIIVSLHFTSPVFRCLLYIY